MHYGMLWYQSNPKMTLAEKVTEAALYFKKKYGRTPDMCLINTKDAAKLPAGTPNQVDVEGRTVHIRSWKGILPSHLCLGYDTEPVRPEPKEAPVKSDAVSAFERHANKVSA